MTVEERKIYEMSRDPLYIIDSTYPFSGYIKLDLSVHNKELSGFDITDPLQCQDYIDSQLFKYRAQIGFGGYLEERNLYKNSPNFQETGVEERNIHLGTDIWAPAGTSVLTPLDAHVYSVRDNKGPGNYGPTAILRHATSEITFYSLYGHLSWQSIKELKPGQALKAGELVGRFGSPEENGHYAPHLHFQLILKLEDNTGDYPGVCAQSSLNFYRSNCPDPNLLIKIPG